MTSQQDYFEDEIDLREIIRSLLQYKWWIIGVTILLAVVAFAFSKLFLPSEYQATAYVMITKPSLTANLDSRIQNSPQLPDARSITDLTKADDLVSEVFQSPGISELLDEDARLAAFKRKLSPSLVGVNQLRLEVTDTDPARAALIANVWAEKITIRLNTLFGVNETSLAQLETQTDQARQEWDAAEQALLAYLPLSQVDSLQVKLNQARDSLKAYLLEMDALDLLVSDAQSLKSRLSMQNPNDKLLIGDALSLISLEQQATGYLEGLQIQIVGAEILGEQYTVAEARSTLDTLISVLESQRDEFQAVSEAKVEEIASIAANLETAQYQVAQLTVQRDLSSRAYQALSSHVEEVQISLSQDDQAVKIAGQALPPERPSGPRSSLNAAVAGAVGFALSVFTVLVLGWWKSTASSDENAVN